MLRPMVGVGKFGLGRIQLFASNLLFSPYHYMCSANYCARLSAVTLKNKTLFNSFSFSFFLSFSLSFFTFLLN